MKIWKQLTIRNLRIILILHNKNTKKLLINYKKNINKLQKIRKIEKNEFGGFSEYIWIFLEYSNIFQNMVF